MPKLLAGFIHGAFLGILFLAIWFLSVTLGWNVSIWLTRGATYASWIVLFSIAAGPIVAFFALRPLHRLFKREQPLRAYATFGRGAFLASLFFALCAAFAFFALLISFIVYRLTFKTDVVGASLLAFVVRNAMGLVAGPILAFYMVRPVYRWFERRNAEQIVVRGHEQI